MSYIQFVPLDTFFTLDLLLVLILVWLNLSRLSEKAPIPYIDSRLNLFLRFIGFVEFVKFIEVEN